MLADQPANGKSSASMGAAQIRKLVRSEWRTETGTGGGWGGGWEGEGYLPLGAGLRERRIMMDIVFTRKNA